MTLLSYAALWAAALDAVAGRPPSLGARVRWLFQPRVFGTVLLTATCVLLGLVACFLPGFVAASVLAFVVAAMVEEERFGTEAFGSSQRLGFFNPEKDIFQMPAFKAFVLIFVATLISYGLSMLIQIPVGLVQQFMILRDSTSDAGLTVSAGWLWLSIPAQIIAGFTTAAVQLYLATGMALLYFDSRRRRDGWDLHAALDELEAGAPASPQPLGEPEP